MPPFKDPGFHERATLARDAKLKALEKLRAKPPVDEAVLAERRAAAEAREAAEAEKRRLKREAEEQAKAERRAKAEAAAQAAAEAEAARLAAKAVPVKTEAEKKAFAGSKQKFEEYIKAAKKGLDKLPAYTGSGVRCTKGLWQDTIDAITKTGGHVEKSFMSVGKEKVSGFGDIEWHFEKIKTGKDISMFSLHQTEGEILFPPGARFKFYRAETTAPDGQPVKFGDFRQFSKYVTPATKVGKFYFQES